MSAGPPIGGPLADVEGIGRAAGPLAHELGQSLAVLSGAVAMLRGTQADTDAVQMLGGVERRLRALTDQLLAIARSGSGR